MRYLLALGLMLAAGLPARAGCTYTGGALNLCLPSVGDSANTWAAGIRANFLSISTNASTGYESNYWATAKTFGLPTAKSSVTVSGDLYVGYGIAAATATFSGRISASSGVFTGAGGLGVTYGIAAATGAFTGGVSVGSMTITGTLTTNATGFFLSNITPITFTNTTFGACAPASTGTITCVGGPCSVALDWVGEWHCTGVGANPYIQFEIDGVGTGYLNSMQQAVTVYYTSVSATYAVFNMAQGTHNFCLSFNSGGGHSCTAGTAGNTFRGIVIH